MITRLLGRVLALAFTGGTLAGCYDEQAASKMMDKIHNQVAADAVKQYEIASRSGNKIDQCVHAGLVAAAYLQTQKESEYKTWKINEVNDCRRAGVPR